MYEHQTSYVSYCRLSEEFPALMCVPSNYTLDAMVPAHLHVLLMRTWVVTQGSGRGPS